MNENIKRAYLDGLKDGLEKAREFVVAPYTVPVDFLIDLELEKLENVQES